MSTMLPRPPEMDRATYDALQKKHEAREAKLAENAEPTEPEFMPIRGPYAENGARAGNADGAEKIEPEPGGDPAPAANTEPEYMPVRSPYDEPVADRAENASTRRAFMTCSASGRVSAAAILDD